MTILLPEDERALLETERDLRSAMLFGHFASPSKTSSGTVVRVVP